MTGEKLLPCPFCGGAAKHIHRPDGSGWAHTDWVSCTGPCGASTAAFETKDEAVAAWNSRHTTARREAFRAGAEAMREAAFKSLKETGRYESSVLVRALPIPEVPE
jgi:Lar family restriction alleviation protein